MNKRRGRLRVGELGVEDEREILTMNLYRLFD